MWEFKRFVWALKRSLSRNRKPIILFFGGGFDSQLLLVALSKIRKHFKVIFVRHPKSRAKVIRKVAKAFPQHDWMFLCASPYNEDSKCFDNSKGVFLAETMKTGFHHDDYCVVTGHKISEPALIKAFQKGVFKGIYTPLLRYSDDWIQTLYQDMKDTEKNGQFMFKHLASDSHHNIEIH